MLPIERLDNLIPKRPEIPPHRIGLAHQDEQPPLPDQREEQPIVVDALGMLRLGEELTEQLDRDAPQIGCLPGDRALEPAHVLVGQLRLQGIFLLSLELFQVPHVHAPSRSGRFEP